MRQKFSIPLLFLATSLVCAGSAGAQSYATQSGSTTGDMQQGPGLSQARNPLYGGVPEGSVTPGVLQLSLADAIKRGLKYNLGFLLNEQDIRVAQGIRMRSRADLLPNLSAGVTETQTQINLAAFGFTGFPGIPMIVGPFNIFDTRAFLSVPLLDFRARGQLREDSENLKAAGHTFKDTRESVVLVCGNLYLEAVAGKSRIDAVRAQFQTAQALYDLAVDRRKAGLAAGIDELRARVQLQAQQQRLITVENDYAKEKLALARAIGLPLGQEFALTDDMAYAPLSGITKESALEQAYQNRGDYLSAQDRVKAAEAEKKAALGESYPSLALNADYGDIGNKPSESHGSFTVAASLRIPIFQGGRVRGKVLEAEAHLNQRQAELEELRSRIYYEVQASFLDLKSAEERVKVAQSARDLAEEEIRQIKDRFAAGVANTVEVVQGQATLADASDSFISSLYTFSLAKGTLAKVMGVAEQAFPKFLRGIY